MNGTQSYALGQRDKERQKVTLKYTEAETDGETARGTHSTEKQKRIRERQIHGQKSEFSEGKRKRGKASQM